MTPITYGSVCSGIEAVSVAWRDLNLTPLWFSETDAFPSAVLAYHWPDIPNLGDMTMLAERIRRDEIPAPAILVGGTPCQSFSVAGMKQGLHDPRGQLVLSYISLADAIDIKRKEENKHAALMLWENVPGILSDTGNAFGHFLTGLAGTDNPFTPGSPPATGKSSAFWRWSEKQGQHIPKWPRAGCVYGARRNIAWRVLDAQYFGLAQRRKRLFVIAGAGTDVDPAKILFEFPGLCGDPPAGSGAQPPIAGSVTAGTGDESGAQTVYNKQRIGEYTASKISSTCSACDYKDAHDLVVFPAVCIAANTIDREPQHGGHHVGLSQELCYTLDTSQSPHAVIADHAVRRMMPVEYERLQGFPDHYTCVPWRGKKAGACPDSLRYKALGNSMPVPVITWLGEQIMNYLQCAH
ncbi:DNA cytosine methyltransferase [Citrobacter portucalensis]|uniref:DNA cytosine methyltransferase n=1 Tax=Citrobacter portucalensis TaxID=1639133 RepID=UPI00226B8FD7|nr:DNA cytosine methyltransferase [Citrobacter portucalensis]MCX8984264.1 DNA cytosine methyltransferase [Citrobacter portucalensis]